MREKPWGLIVGVAAGCLVLGSGIGFFLLDRDSPSPGPPAATPQPAPVAGTLAEIAAASGVAPEVAEDRRAWVARAMKGYGIPWEDRDFLDAMGRLQACYAKHRAGQRLDLYSTSAIMVSRIAGGESREEFVRSVCDRAEHGPR